MTFTAAEVRDMANTNRGTSGAEALGCPCHHCVTARMLDAYASLLEDVERTDKAVAQMRQADSVHDNSWINGDD